jgi:hypothetical protein
MESKGDWYKGAERLKRRKYDLVIGLRPQKLSTK